MKAIKHIRAGLLNIEVIGNVPEPKFGRRKRAARGQPTPPAQQFYNQKRSWRELELRIAANFGHRDYVYTLTFDDAHCPKNKQEGMKLWRKFIRKLGETRKKREQELRYIYVVEGFHGKRSTDYFGEDGELEDCRIHIHAIINSVGKDTLDEIRSLWQFGGYLRAEPIDVHYYRELAKYLTKEAREFGQPKPGERAWHASQNLREYQVEYIEIPSDSVTLAPPHGAVDYVQFSEKNPYGFADCIGARYLLFPEPEKPRYSYTAGRTPPAYHLKP